MTNFEKYKDEILNICDRGMVTINKKKKQKAYTVQRLQLH